MDNREQLMQLFLETVGQSEEFQKYISVEGARLLLDENLGEVVENVQMQTNGIVACYDIVNKNIEFPKNIDIQNITPEDKRVIIHELLHALTRNAYSSDMHKGEVFTGINYMEFSETYRWGKKDTKVYDVGRGLNEGITEWLAEKLVNEKVAIKENNVYDISGIDNIESASYPLHQTLIKELAVLYGEDTIITAYLTNNVDLIKEAIASNPKIENASKTFDDFSDLADSLIEMDRVLNDSWGRKEFRKELRESFAGTQEFFVTEFLDKEIEIAMESHDLTRIEEVKGKIEKLLALNISIKGKGNPFNGVAERFNEQCQSLGIESQVSVKKYTAFDKVKRNFSKSEMMNKGLYFVEAYYKAKGTIKNWLTPKEDIKSLAPAKLKPIELKPVKPKDMVEEIRGLPEEEYEKACECAERAWQERQEERHKDREIENER